MFRSPRRSQSGLTLTFLTCLACGPAPESDYPIYSAVLEDHVREHPDAPLVIRRTAGIVAYVQDVYDSTNSRDRDMFGGLAPQMPISLVAAAQRRIEEGPNLADSLSLEVGYEFIEEDEFVALLDPDLTGLAVWDSIEARFGSGTIIVCLTPPAIEGSHALTFVAYNCWEPFSLGGHYVVLEKAADGWGVVATIPMNVN